MSLRTTNAIALTDSFIYDSERLKIFALKVRPLDRRPACYILTKDIREFSVLGSIVNSDEVFVTPDEVIKLNQFIEADFKLLKSKVYTKSGTYLGKVFEFFVETDDFSIVALNIKRPFLQSITDPVLKVSHTQIKKIDNHKIIVSDNYVEEPAFELPKDFVNPFRQQPISPDQSQSLDQPDTESA